MTKAMPYSAALRVGVTGTRKLDTAEAARLTPEIDAALAAAAAPALVGTLPLLRVISPLAEGSDRLVARRALKAGYRLEVIMPFPQAEYERDFAAPATAGYTPEQCLAEFRELLREATTTLELDGDHAQAGASYEAVGRSVVRNADLLIALWNGEPGKGRGGTAEIVRFALQAGVPVWWVPLDCPGTPPVSAPRWLTEPWQAGQPDEAPAGAEAHAALQAYLRDLLAQPCLDARHHHGLLERLAGHLSREPHRPTGGAWSGPRIWHGAYRFFEGILQAGHKALPAPRPPASDDPAWTYWEAPFHSADDLATSNMAAYRSAYVLVFLLAAVALVGAVLALAWPAGKLAFTLVELVVLLAISRIVIGNASGNWHAQAMSGRLAAELARKQGYLSLLADTLPIRPGAVVGPVGQAFAAARREAPLPHGVAKERLARIREQIAVGLLQDQEIYHRNRMQRFRLISGRLAWWGEALFLATAILVGIKVLLLVFHLAHETAVGIGIVSAILPAAAAFSVGIRSYAEFDLLAGQSEEMAHVMASAQARLARVDPGRPNASAEMADILREVTETMLRDVQGWSAVSKSKVVEAG